MLGVYVGYIYVYVCSNWTASFTEQNLYLYMENMYSASEQLRITYKFIVVFLLE